LNRTAAFAAAMTTLRDAAVRDLAWLLLAPYLLSESAFGELLANRPVDDDLLGWLRALDADPAALHLSLTSLRSSRVGHYAERLVHFALSHSPHFRLVAANLPLRVQKQTVGECDFLLEDTEGRRLHWELAVKCYLNVGAEDSLAGFVGPALGDRLDIKLRRMLEHQLPLSGRADYAALLPPGPWFAQMWVSGWLFDRFDRWHEGRALNVDPRLAADLLSGFWAPRHAWLDVQTALGADGWTRLPRLRWMAPLAEPDQSYCDAAAMSEQIDAAFIPWMVADADAASADAVPVGARSGNGNTGSANADNANADNANTGAIVSVGAALADALPTARKSRDDPFAIAAWKKGTDGRLHEIARGFIVADDWEARAIAFAAHDQR
jgi:hypothetical protein